MVMNMKNKLNEIINQSNEQLCILVHDMKENKTLYQHNQNVQVVSASTIKVPIMLYALNEVMNNKCSLNTKLFVSKEIILEDSEVFEQGPRQVSLYELLMWMIIKSDNTSTNVLINYFTMNKINEYCETVLETKSTSVQRIMLDFDAITQGKNNYTSQEDLCKMFIKLYNKEILDEQLCEVAMSILLNQRCQDQIVRYIYDPVQYAHKTGDLDYLHHDAGIMHINNKWYYIGCSVKSNTNMNGNYPLIGKIGRIIYDEIKGQ